MPETIGSLIISAVNYVAGTEFVASSAAITIGETTITAGQIVGTVALTTLSIALRPDIPSPTSQKIATRNPVAARRRYYGRCRVGGVLAELKVSEQTGDGILYVVTMLASGEIDDIEEHRISDEVTRINGTGQVTYPGVWLDVNRVQLHYQLGTTSQVADTFLTTAFPGRWTSEHQLNGIAYTVGKFNGVPLEDFATVYKAGIPNYSAIIRGAKVYDPRASNHDWDDPATWEWTENAALIIMDYLWHDDGMRLPRALIAAALDDWIAAADYCDEIIPLIGSTETGEGEARYRLAGGYDFSELPRDVLSRMLAPIDGRVRLREDSAIVLDVGMFTTPTAAETFTDDDIIAYTNFRRGRSKTELKNEIRATYTSPGHDYQTQEADPWRDEASILIDGLQSATLQLDMCPSHAQARRRMKVEAHRQNPDWMGTIITNARGLNLIGKRYAHFTISDLGIDESFYIAKSNIDLLAGTCTFEVVSFPSTAYDWEANEEGLSPESETPGKWGVVVPSNTTSVTITADGAGGGGSGLDGGGGGARSIKTIAIDPIDWGATIQFEVGRGGIGDPPDIQSSTNGGASTVTGTLLAGIIAMIAGGGESGFNGHQGGTASGGDTNTSGNGASGGDGGAAASGALENEYPGGGGHEGHDGGHGRVTFDWVYS